MNKTSILWEKCLICVCVYWLKQVTAEWIVMSQMLVRATPGEANDREHSILYHYGHHEPISHEDNDLDFIYLWLQI